MQGGMMQAGQGMMGSMYNQQAKPHLPQLAQPPMGPNMMGYGPMGPQPFGAMNSAPGMCMCVCQLLSQPNAICISGSPYVLCELMHVHLHIMLFGTTERQCC